jgi:hypothetical protein
MQHRYKAMNPTTSTTTSSSCTAVRLFSTGDNQSDPMKELLAKFSKHSGSSAAADSTGMGGRPGGPPGGFQNNAAGAGAKRPPLSRGQGAYPNRSSSNSTPDRRVSVYPPPRQGQDPTFVDPIRSSFPSSGAGASAGGGAGAGAGSDSVSSAPNSSSAAPGVGGSGAVQGHARRSMDGSRSEGGPPPRQPIQHKFNTKPTRDVDRLTQQNSPASSTAAGISQMVKKSFLVGQTAAAGGYGDSSR